MEAVLATCSASISELKKNPSALSEQSGDEPITILNQNKPTAHLIPSVFYGDLLEKMEDYQLRKTGMECQSEKSKAVEVSLDKL